MVKKIKRTKNDSPAKKFLRGDVPLVTSFWGIYIGASLAVGFGLGLLVPSVVLLIVLIIAWTVFTIIGTWRSADKYKGKKLWSNLAKVWIVIGVISSIVRISRYL